MSLRTVHLLFVLLAIVGADLFGAWTIWQYVHGGSLPMLLMGIAAVLGGFGLIWYSIRLVRSLDKAHIH